MGEGHSRSQDQGQLTKGPLPAGKTRCALLSGRTSFREDKDMLQSKTVMPDRILEVGYAFWKSKALLSAVELDLFTVLADGPLDLETLVSRIGIHTRSALDFP